MDCRDFRKLASKAHDGEATGLEEMELAEHLERCPSCRAFDESLADISALHAGMEQAGPPAGLLDEVLSRTCGNVRIPAWWKVGIAAAAAVVILLGIWTGAYLTSGYDRTASVQQAELFEMEYLGPYPPGSLGETLDRSLEGDADV